MKTAVEWLIEELWQAKKTKSNWKEIEDKAKAMEKEQIMRSHSSGYNSGLENKIVLSYEYYIKTFKSE